MRLGTPANAGEIGLRGTVAVTEQLGDEQILAVRLGDNELRIAGVDPDLTLPAGTAVEAVVAAGNLHFFQGEGARITG